MKVLEGVTVIDFTQAYSGPFCVMQLADFGARIIKIERAGSGDQSREWTPFRNDYSGYYASINRNKESVSLDIGREEGQKIVRELVRNADIVVENFKCGTMEKYGLHYEEMKKINPGLIFASLSGFGQTGPYKNLAAYDNVIQSMAGTMDVTGYPHGDPLRVGPGIGDSFTGLLLANGIVMAYLHKLETGEGQFINIAMLDALFGILENAILHKTVLNQELTRMGTRDVNFAPYDVYNCKDGLYTVAITTDKDFAVFCEAIGKPEMANDPRFKTNADRMANYDVLTELIAPFFANQTRSELDVLFTAANIPGGMVQDIPEVMADKQLTAREMFWEIDDPGIGLHRNMANPMKLSAAPPTLRNGSPLLGQDTDKVLMELGYSEAEIAALRENGIV
jgi:CoA:oxalate CoA-transferase